tara:strand:+ start:1349 stop:1657 length:309 start_codon:yes stop_codon:yes gene_type:complete
MTPVVEVRMLVKTQEGDKNVNFYTVVKLPSNLEPDDFDDYFCSSVSDSVDEILCRMKETINSGLAVAIYRGDELFTFSFFKAKEEDRWKYQTMFNQNDPTIH